MRYPLLRTDKNTGSEDHWVSPSIETLSAVLLVLSFAITFAGEVQKHLPKYTVHLQCMSSWHQLPMTQKRRRQHSEVEDNSIYTEHSVVVTV